MEISQAKFFIKRVYKDNKIYIGRELESIIKDSKVGCFAIMPTDAGDILFEVDKKYDDTYFIWHKFMHILSFLKFNNYATIVCLDESSYRYIKSVYEQQEHKLQTIIKTY
jgi:hypothetical protein